MLQRFKQELAGTSDLNEAVGMQVRADVRDYLIAVAGSRHASAIRLGATPSGHWAQAAEKTTFAATAESVTVSVKHPGIRRAVQDIDILPGPGKKYLTIPLIAAAYNVRAYRMRGLFFKLSKQGNPILWMKEGKSIRPVYLLKPAVHQKQDRTLLPAEEALRKSALMGVRTFVRSLIAKKEGA